MINHKQLYKQFAECLPDYADRVKLYFKKGSTGILLRMTDGEEYMFSVGSNSNWKFERMK